MLRTTSAPQPDQSFAAAFDAVADARRYVTLLLDDLDSKWPSATEPTRWPGAAVGCCHSHGRRTAWESHTHGVHGGITGRRGCLDALPVGHSGSQRPAAVLLPKRSPPTSSRSSTLPQPGSDRGGPSTTSTAPSGDTSVPLVRRSGASTTGSGAGSTEPDGWPKSSWPMPLILNTSRAPRPTRQGDPGRRRPPDR